MSPIIHCVRHAQGFHNLSHANHIIPDPLLTPHGESQCRDLSAEFPHHSQIDLVVASPLRRTIYTALLAFEDQIKNKGLTIIALPEIQETSDVPCDVGSDLTVLQKEVDDNGLPVDLKLVGEDWNSKKEKWAPSAEAIANRAREARRWLKARPEKEIVIVTHGGFLHYFTEDWEDSTLYQGTGWRNTEYRTYTFAASVDQDDLYGRPVDGDNASIIETRESRTRRGRPAEAPSRDLQKQFFVQAMTGWENQILEFAKQEAAKKGPAGVDIEENAGEKVVIADGAEDVRVIA
ncbi:phosphoglycerate mutase [Blastomyces dermatitidis ER-3]|uniref:Phosphoglycerate mutase n=2 Tax=Blastomyces TaxID=229219 RepID=A0A179UQF3_BLAGS|nr:phosphoglycerate mutase [Blastomyces gilchristii SLH14081]XP_045271774.1 phosphoglycerate mutase [Blastomyces dermatitidis ER-3]EEQ83626.2 phosphoglycerate mutase [Blastomyces dermatitidis ER-3]OAT08632.1 phosphoglycerate mutase [Blastomyces gilchristii SLH14081]